MNALTRPTRPIASAAITIILAIRPGSCAAALSHDRPPPPTPPTTWRADAVRDKLHPLLRAPEWPRWAHASQPRSAEKRIDADAVVAACVSFDDAASLLESLALLRAHDARIVARLQTINAWLVELPQARVTGLAATSAVRWIEPPLPAWSEHNDANRAATGVATVQAAPYGLSGNGVVVMIYDSGRPSGSHADFEGRLTSQDIHLSVAAHATHVAGIIGGAGVQSGGQFRGMAPAVLMHAYGYERPAVGIALYSNPGDLEEDYADALLLHSAVLANNSVGTQVSGGGLPCSLLGDYGATSTVIDSIAYGALGADVRMVWSAGNERGNGACGNTYATLAPPACAKNPIVVGAVNADDLSISAMSGWGPCDDGRIKPDVAAPGCEIGGDNGVTSTAVNTGYAVMCGSSMAAATVTGIAALLLEDHRAQFPARPDPGNAALKALLVHTAQDLAAAGPDYQTGYGMVRADRAVDHLRTGQFIESEVVAGQSRQFYLSVAPDAAMLQVTLAWDDPPADPSAATALVNDLDLVVIGPSGQAFPWTLNPQNPAAAAVQTQSDHINNVEQVVVADPAAGLWSVTVHAFNLSTASQRFALTAEPGLMATAILLPNGLPSVIAPGVGTAFDVTLACVGETPVPGSANLRYRFGGTGPFAAVALMSLGGERYRAQLPPASCQAAVEYYVEVEGAATGAVLFPAGGATAPLRAVVGVESVLFGDDFETDRGWTVGGPQDTATGGIWTRVNPNGTAAQPEDYHTPPPGTMCFVTGQGPVGGTVGQADVDNGRTTLTSPIFDLSGAADAVIGYWRWYSNAAGAAPNEDVFLVEITADGGQNWTPVEMVGPTGPATLGNWFYHEFRVGDFVSPTSAVRVRFVAADDLNASIVEAAVDDFFVRVVTCDGDATPGDLNGDGAVDESDVAIFVAVLTGTDTDPIHTARSDLDGNGVADGDDVPPFVAILCGN